MAKIKKSYKSKKKLYISFLLVVFVVWLLMTNILIETTNISIINDKIPNSFNDYKIAVISDLHNKDWKDNLIKKINQAQPDIIVIVGDLIDSSKTNLDVALTFVEKAKVIAPIYYVSGNHEAWSSDYQTLKTGLILNDVVILDDESTVLNMYQENISLMGLQDPDFTKRGAPLYETSAIALNKIEAMSKDDNRYKILLSHRPELFDAYQSGNIDLVISGHAHGGQGRLPFIGGLVAPNQGFFPKYTSGLYSENGTDVIVSRGLGNSIIPLRINNRPQLVILTLNKQ